VLEHEEVVLRVADTPVRVEEVVVVRLVGLPIEA
jgi:hypothetical protein